MKFRILVMCLCLAMIPFVSLLVGHWWIGNTTLAQEQATLADYAYQDLDHIVEAMHTACEIQNAAGITPQNADFNAFADMTIGETGHPICFTGEGTLTVHPDRVGVNVWNDQDSEGNLFVQEMSRTARQILAGADEMEILQVRYPWRGRGDAEPREMVVRYTYFEPWDWVITAGAFEDEFFGAVRQAEADHARNLRTLLLIGLIVMGLTTLIAHSLSRRVAAMLNRISTDLSAGGNQVASAAGELASASQTLAAGASDQAASLEQVSTSLEQMGAMTKQNADNTHHASALMSETKAVVSKGGKSMERMVTSMDEIREASVKILDIIKTIEEIAFQTNLLALNAAVEAARAGEHGRGFAVVADEVRNLATRAKDAAKHTAELIEGAVGSAERGSKTVEETSRIFENITDSSEKVAALIAEIDSASREQALGISQISGAVIHIDQVTQQSAANAEEAASASEELSAQAEIMRHLVLQLEALIETGKMGVGDSAVMVSPNSGDAKTPAAVNKSTVSDHTRDLARLEF